MGGGPRFGQEKAPQSVEPSVGIQVRARRSIRGVSRATSDLSVHLRRGLIATAQKWKLSGIEKAHTHAEGRGAVHVLLGEENRR